MNKLIEKLQKKYSPVIFSFDELKKLNFEEKTLYVLFNEAIEKKWIDNVYKNIYTLNINYAKTLVSEGVIAQIIDPDSYVSGYSVLRDAYWIPEEIFMITSITEKDEKNEVNLNKYGRYRYEKLYDDIFTEGIYIESNETGKYLRAKPLRALCDIMYSKKEEYYNVEYIEEYLRISSHLLKKELNARAFDELQGKTGINKIEHFLENIRSELNI